METHSIHNIFNKFTHLFSPCVVYALVGESGTGKSFRSKLLAQKYGINTIIDDGLLIQEDRILAGRSAKREKTYMGAVRVALFDNKEHRDDVARVLQRLHLKKILVLATSERMASKIALRLQLPQPQTYIHIEDIATREEIEKAMKARQVEGKHVIPVPSIEVKKNYPQIFSNSIKVFLRKNGIFKKRGVKGKLYEKSIVEPEFSKKGRIEISEAALTQMIMHCVLEYNKEFVIKKIVIKTSERGYKIIMSVNAPYGEQLTGSMHKLQQYIIDKIESYTGILIEEVSIIIDKLIYNKSANSKE